MYGAVKQSISLTIKTVNITVRYNEVGLER